MNRRQQRVKLEEEVRRRLEAGETYRQIAKELHVGQTTISQIASCKEMNHTIGRPKCLRPEIVEFIELHSLADARISDEQMREMIVDRFDVVTSRSTVARVRSKLGFKYRPAMTRQVLTDAQVQHRLEFAQAVLSGADELPNILFTDESRFERFPDNTWRRIKRGCWNETCFVERAKYSAGVMIWAGIGFDFKSNLVICRNSVDAPEYIKILLSSGAIEGMNRLHGRGRWTLMQDGAPSHFSEVTLDWLHKNKVAVVPGWPANSPDLNPIENLWAIMKRQVKKHVWKNNEKIDDILLNIWASLDQTMINKLVISFFDRCKMVVALGGTSISQNISSHRRAPSTVEVAPPDDRNHEEEAVMELVERFGRRWTMIGQQMGCRPSHAKYVWQRARQRKWNIELRSLPAVEAVETEIPGLTESQEQIA